MMATFILSVVGSALGFVLVMVLAFVLMSQPKVMKAYMNYCNKLGNKLVDTLCEDEEAKDL